MEISDVTQAQMFMDEVKLFEMFYPHFIESHPPTSFLTL